MRYFVLIFGLCVLVVMGILGKRGSHFRKPPLYIFPDMEWQLKLRRKGQQLLHQRPDVPIACARHHRSQHIYQRD
jgi:hypothetical protein